MISQAASIIRKISSTAASGSDASRAGSGVVRELVELAGDPQRVVSIADLGAPEFGVRFSGVAGIMPVALAEAVDLISRGKLHIPVEKSYTLAEAAAAHIDSQAGHTRGRRVMVI